MDLRVIEGTDNAWRRDTGDAVVVVYPHDKEQPTYAEVLWALELAKRSILAEADESVEGEG